MDKSFSFNLLIHPALKGEAYDDRHIIVFQPSILNLLGEKPSCVTDIFCTEMDDDAVMEILQYDGEGLPPVAMDLAVELQIKAEDIYHMQFQERQMVASQIVRKMRTAAWLYRGAVKGYPF